MEYLRYSLLKRFSSLFQNAWYFNIYGGVRVLNFLRFLLFLEMQGKKMHFKIHIFFIY